MPKQIKIPVTLDARTFRRYCAFDALIRQRRWYWPALVSMVLITIALAGLLSLVPMSDTVSGLLMGLGLAVILLNVGLYALPIEIQIASQGLKASPTVYALILDGDGLQIENRQKDEPPVRIPWEKLWAAYAYKGDVYLYANPEKALILPEGQASVPQATLWAYLEGHLGSDKCFRYGSSQKAQTRG